MLNKLSAFVLIGLLPLSVSAGYVETAAGRIYKKMGLDWAEVQCVDTVTKKRIYNPEYKAISVIGIGGLGWEENESRPAEFDSGSKKIMEKITKAQNISTQQALQRYLTVGAVSIKNKKKPVNLSVIGAPEFSNKDNNVRIPLINGMVANFEFYQKRPEFKTEEDYVKYTPYFFYFWFDGEDKQNCRLRFELNPVY